MISWVGHLDDLKGPLGLWSLLLTGSTPWVAPQGAGQRKTPTSFPVGAFLGLRYVRQIDFHIGAVIQHLLRFGLQSVSMFDQMGFNRLVLQVRQ